MGIIKKILQDDLVGYTGNQEVYPVTSTSAVYGYDGGKRLDKILLRNMPVNISTDQYFPDTEISPITLESALSRVPPTRRSWGAQVTFMSVDGWVSYRFNRIPLDQYEHIDDYWENPLYWVRIANISDVNNILNEEGDYVSLADFGQSEIGWGDNFFNPCSIIKGKYISYNDNGIGDIRNATNPEFSAISDFIEIEASVDYVVKFGDRGTCASKVIAFYDEDKNPLHDGIVVGRSSEAVQFRIPLTAAYMVLSFGSLDAWIPKYVFKYTKVIQGDLSYFEENYQNDYSLPYLELPNYIQKPTSYGDTYLDDYLSDNNYTKYTLETGKNLFNKFRVIEGYYVNRTTGVLTPSPEAAVSPLIPISPGKIYHIERPCSTECPIVNDVRFVAADGITPLKPLNVDGSERDSYNNTRNTSVKAPDGAGYLQCTLKYNQIQFNYDTVQIEEGESFTGYESYWENWIVDYPRLPANLNGLANKVKNLENFFSETINIANSDKIGFFSNSFLNGYCMIGKHAINNLSMFSDYIMYNYGHSGDDLLESLSRIEQNQSWLGEVPVQDWGIKYGIIAMQTNDGSLFKAASDTYYQNAKKLSEAIKSMGGIPILATEHKDNNYYYNFARLAQEEGYMMMNWGYKAAKLFVRIFAPFWYQGHPSTRTAWMWTYGMKPYLDTLPRPNKSIKLFRVRAEVDTSNLQNLIYEDFISRAERFEELSCGVSALTEETDKYFDRLDDNQKTFTTYKDEYQNIQQRLTGVSFGNYALVEVITPYDSNGIIGMSVNIDQTGVSNVYIKKTISISNPLPANRVIAFKIISGGNLLPPGSIFEITGGVSNNLLGQYTVDNIINGILITTTNSSGKTVSNADIPICATQGVVLEGSYDYPTADYMSRYNKPLGEWIELTADEDGKYTLDDYLSTCMMYDKVGLLLQGTNINIIDIQCRVSGNVKKNRYSKLLVSYKNGTSLINDTLLDDGTSWTGIESLSKYEPVVSTVSISSKEPLPTGITTVREMNVGDFISQTLISSELSNNSYEPFKIQIRVIARYFPEYIDTDEKWETSELKRGTFDCAKLAVMIGSSASDTNPAIIGEISVGAWWNEFILDSQYYTGSQLIIKCLNKHVQIAKVEIVKV